MAKTECYIGRVNIHHATPDDVSATHIVGNLGEHWWLDIGAVTVCAENADDLLDIATKVMTSVLDIVPDSVPTDEKLLGLVRERLCLTLASC